MAERQRVYIHAASAVVPAELAVGARRALTQDPDIDLGAHVKRILGQRLRQASHFIELATVGARLCLQKLPEAPPPDIGIYVGTGLGDLRKNEILFRQVFPPGLGAAAPFDFINATANVAAFYVARIAGASARNLTITQGQASFEDALRVACDDLRNGELGFALVGGVDENCFPRDIYVRRWRLRDDEIMGEGSAWLALSTQSARAIAELLVVRTARVASTELPPLLQSITPAVDGIVYGAQLHVADRAALAQAFPSAQHVTYAQYCGSYPTAASYGVASQLEASPVRGTWLHLNRNTDGSVKLVGWCGR
jgi:hypothetical protein